MPAPLARWLPFLVSSALLLACACAGSSGGVSEQTPDEVFMPEYVIPRGDDAERTEDGLVRVDTPKLKALVYVKPPRPRLDRYDRMYVNMPQIRYKRGVRHWEQRDEAVLMSYLRNVFVEKLSGQVWELVEDPGPGVLFVRISLLEVDIEPARRRSEASTSFVEAGGGAILALEFFDSETAEPLFRYVEKRELPVGVYSGAAVEQDRLKHAVGDFASNLSRFVETTFGVVREIERRERGGEPG